MKANLDKFVTQSSISIKDLHKDLDVQQKKLEAENRRIKQILKELAKELEEEKPKSRRRKKAE